MSLVSPELALVDPILRADALADLPALEPFAFLRFAPLAAATAATASTARRPPLAVAAVVYLIAAAARTLVIDSLFVLVLAGALFALQALI